MGLKLLHRTPGRGGFATPPGYGVEDPHDRPWWTRPGFVFSGLFLGLVLVLGAGLLFFHDTPGGDPAHPTIPAVPAAPARDACKPSPAHPPTLPLAPGQTQWRQIGAVKAPVVDGLGPAAAVQVSNPISGAEGQLPTCYAPGPGGALLASANWLAAGTDSALVDSAIRELTAPSAGRQAMVARLEADPASLNASGSTGYEFTGYRFDYQSDTQVTVSLAILTSRGATGAVSMTVVYDQATRDWLVVPPPSGDIRDITTQLESPAGYTPWS